MSDSLRKLPAHSALEARILCHFWFEDEVWNAEAVDIPVVVYGSTFEEAKSLVLEAVVGHLQALQKLGQLETTIAHLRSKERESRSSLPSHEPLLNFPVAVTEHEVFALC